MNTNSKERGNSILTRRSTRSPKSLQHFSQKFVTIVLTFSLRIILRQFPSPFHKDYLMTNFNLTTKITLTIKNSSLGVLIQHYVIKFVSDLGQVNGFLRVLQFSPPIKLTDILLKGALKTINHLPQQPSFISIAQQSIFFNKIILKNIPALIYKQFLCYDVFVCLY